MAIDYTKMTDSDRSDVAFDSISTDTIHLPEDPDAYGEIVGAVPIGVLEDLADEWRDKAQKQASLNNEWEAIRITECAESLEDTIADYTDE